MKTNRPTLTDRLARRQYREGFRARRYGDTLRASLRPAAWVAGYDTADEIIESAFVGACDSAASLRTTDWDWGRD